MVTERPYRAHKKNGSIYQQPNLKFSRLAANGNGSPSSADQLINLDRFIPSVTCKRVFQSARSLRCFRNHADFDYERQNTPHRLSSPQFFTDIEITGGYSSMGTEDSTFNSETSSISTISPPSYAQTSPPIMFPRRGNGDSRSHKDCIASSLGLSHSERVFSFHHSGHSSRATSARKLLIPPSLGASLFSNCDDDNDNNNNNNTDNGDNSSNNPNINNNNNTNNNNNSERASLYSNRKRTSSRRAKSYAPTRVLDAPALRNDFYTNLVSWSQTTGRILVGLGCAVYLWSAKHGAAPIMNNSFLSSRNDYVTCVSFSPVTSMFLVGTKLGSLFLYDQVACSSIHQSENASHVDITTVTEPRFEFCTNSYRGITCIEWFKGGRSNLFAAGEETGEVSVLRIDEAGTSQQGSKLVQIAKFQAQSQQVCGLSINYNNSLIAVGGNDNTCTLWNIEDYQRVKLKFILRHDAAIKAVAFCPWSRSLLATGGGSKDRTIKFWHTGTGTLLKQIKTSGQITSLIWSRRHKQIAATFGFSDAEKPSLLILYSYPALGELLNITSPTPLRVLTAVISPNCTSICLATNDETIRFYQLWDEKEGVIEQIQVKGIYGSELIELMEGIHSSDRKKGLR